MKNIIIIFCIILLCSCGKKKVFEKNIEMDNYEWTMDKKLTFDVPIDDTSSFYNVYIPVRHIDNYPYDGLLVNVTMDTPSGEERTKNYKLQLRDDNGNFKGDAGGDIWDIDVPIMEKIKFNSLGTFKFTIENNMPKTPTVCLMEVGLKVEKVK
ncbi:MAG TPA: gliding motility lipoprotein GldH [Bacteroidales bacterium]|nr:gliding motility lipoprotein GldH [Bacteroidales bacterium]HPS17284.1 gliding motility lipoprotein GldH [Bacteroidales bacterium]